VENFEVRLEKKINKLRRRRNVVEKSHSESKKLDAIDDDPLPVPWLNLFNPFRYFTHHCFNFTGRRKYETWPGFL